MSDTQLASMRSGSVASMMDIDEILGVRRAKWGKNIFILDGQTGDFLDHIHRDDVVYNRHKQSLPDHLEMFEMTVVGDKRYAVHLGNDNKLIVPGEDGELLEFRIFEVGKYRKDDTLTIEVFSRATYLDLLTARVFDPMQTDPLTAQEHAEQALFNTGWQVGDVDFSGVRTLTFDNPFNPYDYLRRIAREFELEPRFYVMTDGQRVTGRYVDLVDRIGEWRGRTVEFGFDLQGLRRTEKTENIVTALYGYGPEREDGTRLKVFVEDLDALQRWGRDGRHIVDIYEPQTEDENMTEERLTTLTQAELNKRINAAVEYEADIVDLENVPGMENKVIRFADTIRIKDKKFNPALYVEARVHTQERDVFTRANKRVELGDFVEYTQEEVQAIWKQLQEQIRQKISRADLVEYAERKVQRDTIPPENTEHLWLDTSTEPNVLKRYDEAKTDWVKATPTEADEVGAETPEGAQQKADEAKQEAISYSENFTISYAQKQISSSTTPPANPEIGDLWFDSSTQPPTFRRWNGTEWEKLSASSFEELEGMIDKDQLPDRVIDSVKLAIDAVQAENLAPSSVDTENLLDDAITNAKMAANAVSSINIQNGAVNNDKLDNLAVTAEKLASGAVVEDKIFDGAVGSAKLADAAITSAKISEAAINEAHIAEAAVGTAAIQDLAVTNAKIDNIHADKITSGVIAAERVAIGPLSHFADGYDPTKIEVGGRNFLLNSTFNYGSEHWQITSGMASIIQPESDKPHSRILHVNYQDHNANTPRYNTRHVPVKADGTEKIRVSFDIFVPDFTKFDGTIFTIRSFDQLDGGSYVDPILNIGAGNIINKGLVEGEWFRYSTTIDVPQMDEKFLGFGYYLPLGDIEYKLREIKVEFGEKATDWTPAPEDNPALLWQYEDTAYIDGGNIYANTVTANQIAAGAITANELAANAVTAQKIQAEAVGAQAIAANAILAKHIAAGEVTANHLAAEAVTADAIAAGAILAEHLSANSIDSSKIVTEGLDASVIKTGVIDTSLVQIGGTGATRAQFRPDHIEFYRDNSYTGQVTTAEYDNNRDQILVHSPDMSSLASSDDVGSGALGDGAFVSVHNSSNPTVELHASKSSESTLYLTANDGVSVFGHMRVFSGNLTLYDRLVLEPTAPASGTILAYFNAERPWTLRQRGSGSSAGLRLQSEYPGGKSFWFTGSNNNEAMRIQVHDSSPGNVRVYGDFSVSGDKAAIVETENFGKRLMYALETPDSRFMDVVEVTLGPGEHWVYLNEMFAEAINGYSVFPIAQDGGRVQVLEREQKRFKLRVSGEKDVDVACWVYGKRIGREDIYMEKVKEEDELEHNEH